MYLSHAIHPPLNPRSASVHDQQRNKPQRTTTHRRRMLTMTGRSGIIFFSSFFPPTLCWQGRLKSRSFNAGQPLSLSLSMFPDLRRRAGEHVGQCDRVTNP